MYNVVHIGILLYILLQCKALEKETEERRREKREREIYIVRMADTASHRPRNAV